MMSYFVSDIPLGPQAQWGNQLKGWYFIVNVVFSHLEQSIFQKVFLRETPIFLKSHKPSNETLSFNRHDH